MDDTIFVIPQRTYGKESKVITMRIGTQLLSDLDAAAEASGRSRNEIISLALEFSLNHLVITDKSPTPEEAENALHLKIQQNSGPEAR